MLVHRYQVLVQVGATNYHWQRSRESWPAIAPLMSARRSQRRDALFQ
jgi:hypothetical protein